MYVYSKIVAKLCPKLGDVHSSMKLQIEVISNHALGIELFQNKVDKQLLFEWFSVW